MGYLLPRVIALVDDKAVAGVADSFTPRHLTSGGEHVRQRAGDGDLGHGFGLFPHETPHLNPRWDDAFEEGDVFAAEPGLYGPELKAGIRLEQNYRLTADGVERLTSFPLEL